MTIEISYTESGVAFKQDARETIELPLSSPSESVGQKSSRSPERDTIPPTQPVEEEPTEKQPPIQRRQAPPVFPRAMAVITKDMPTVLCFKPTDEAEREIPKGLVMGIDELQKLAKPEISKRIALLRHQSSTVQADVLNVVVSPAQTKQIIDEKKLQEIVNDSQVELSSIKLYICG